MLVKHYNTRKEAEDNCPTINHKVVAEGNAVVRYRVIGPEKQEQILNNTKGGPRDLSQSRENKYNDGFGKMKPSELCKSAGLKSLAELSEFSGESVQTLNNWFKNEPRRFELVLKGVMFEKAIRSLDAATRT